MSIVCPQCNTPVSDSAIQNKQAKCCECGYEFSVARLLQADQNRKKVEMVYDIPMPPRIHQVVNGDRLVITRTWQRWMGAFTLIWALTFGVIWVSVFSVFVYTISPYLVVLPILIYLSVVVSGVYKIVNQTVIQVDPKVISVNHRPLPARICYFASQDIVQVYVVNQLYHNSLIFHVVMLLENGKSKQLVKNLPNAAQALYIEQEVERFLGIENLPVRGEYTPVNGVLGKVYTVGKSFMPMKNGSSRTGK